MNISIRQFAPCLTRTRGKLVGEHLRDMISHKEAIILLDDPMLTLGFLDGLVLEMRLRLKRVVFQADTLNSHRKLAKLASIRPGLDLFVRCSENGRIGKVRGRYKTLPIPAVEVDL